MEDGARGVKEVKKRNNQKSKKIDKIWFSETEFKRRQNLPEDLPRRPTDIYLISTDFVPEQYQRALRLLRHEAVWIHSLGSNIPVAITFLNKLKAELTEDKLEVETWSHTWQGLSDHWECRNGVVNSGLHFKIVLKGSD